MTTSQIRSLVLVVLMPMCSYAFGQKLQSLPLPELQTFASVFNQLNNTLVPSVERSALLVHAIRGMVRGADPEGGEYFTEEEYLESKEGLPAGIGDVGVTVLFRGGQPVLVPADGGPARKSGVFAGDVLLSIDGTAVDDLSQAQVLRRLRGPAGTKANLLLFRPGLSAQVVLAVERAELRSPDLAVVRLQSDLLLLRVPEFSANTLQMAVDATRKEWSKGLVKGLILDLRSNQGGVLEQAVGLAAMFLPEGAVIAEMSSGAPLAKRTVLAANSSYSKPLAPDPLAGLPAALKILPLAVLVDDGTVAGAELTAMALRDNKRAVIVGRTTYGRSSIQTITPLRGMGATKMTTGFWSSPSGQRLSRKGITPDLLVPDFSNEVVLEAAIGALRGRK